MLTLLSSLLLFAGAAFYCAGTLGLLRFPDVYCRLHALTKADTLGLGCIALGVAMQAETLALACKILLVWPLVLLASAAVSHAIAHRAAGLGLRPDEADDAA